MKPADAINAETCPKETLVWSIFWGEVASESKTFTKEQQANSKRVVKELKVIFYRRFGGSNEAGSS